MFSFVRTFSKSPLIRRNMSKLLKEIDATWRNGVDSNELVIFHSKLHYVKDHNYDVATSFLKVHVQFIVRQLERNNLPKKGSTIKSVDKKIDDPFSKENRNSTLIVHEYKDHTLLLNKFPVLKNHVR